MKETSIQIHIIIGDKDTNLQSDLQISFDSLENAVEWLNKINPLTKSL